MDIVAYAGTTLILIGTGLKRRTFSHIVRMGGNFLWLVYGIMMGSLPLIITELLFVVIDLYAAIKYKEQGK